MTTVLTRPLSPGESTAARRLAPRPEQADLVATVDESLMAAHLFADAVALGVFADGTLVGFMMGQPLGGDEGDFLIWDFFIDRNHQGRGLGEAGVRAALPYAASIGCSAVKLAYAPENLAARSLYRKVGFVETGTVNADGEIEMRCPVA